MIKILNQALLLILLLMAESSAQTLLNTSVQKDNIYLKMLTSNQALIGGMICYAVVGYIYSRVLFQLRNNPKGLNVANSLWNAGIQICIAIIGVSLFKEKMTALNWFGNFLMAVGLLLVI